MRRRKAIADPVAFTRYCFQFEPAAHHVMVLNALNNAINGGADRIMICMPPGHGKSTYGSWVFPAYALGNKKALRIIGASHTDALANVWSARVRNTIKSQEYKLLFEFGLISEAVERWETEVGGEYVAVGVSHGIAGRRANLAIIDDPFPDAESAESRVYRDKVWRWYQDDLMQRLLPGAAVVLIQTRFHEDDLAGRLLKAEQEGGDQWLKLILPAPAEENDPLGRAPGAALWPEMYGDEIIARRRRNMSPRSFAALWQQQPTPEGGDFFQLDWFKYYDRAPDNLRIYMSSDYAATPGEGDFTVFVVAGVDERGDIYILDLWRGQQSPDRWIEAGFGLIEKYNPLVWVEESGPIWRAVNPFIQRRQLESPGHWTLRRQIPSLADKGARARAFQGRMAMGQVYFPKDAPWMTKLLMEMLRFNPAAKDDQDDQVDALGLLGRMLHTMSPARPKPKPRADLLKETAEKLNNPPLPTMDGLWKEHDRYARSMRRMS